MKENNSLKGENSIYFLTLTVLDWVGLFTSKTCKFSLTESLNYFIRKEGLIVYAYVIMSNHIHLIAKANMGYVLEDILEKFKVYTTQEIVNILIDEPGNKSAWILEKMGFDGEKIKGKSKKKLWQDDYQALLLDSDKLIDDKIDYIHNDPVEAMIVEKPDHYIFSSANDFIGFKGFVDVETDL